MTFLETAYGHLVFLRHMVKLCRRYDPAACALAADAPTAWPG